MSKLEKSYTHLIHIYINYLQISLFIVCLHHGLHSYDVIPDFWILSRWFSAGSTIKSFGVKKHELNTDKYFSKHFS